MSATETTATATTPAGTPDYEYALEIVDLCIDVDKHGERVPAVKNLTIRVRPGESHGLVGESGSGKSLTLRAVMGLFSKGAYYRSGYIKVCGKEVLGPDAPQYDPSMRGRGVAMAFQEPAVALNPIMKVGWQIVDALREQEHLSRAEARRRAIELMDSVGITNPEDRFDAYPFELSGGMRQRVMIAASIACKPKVLLCDEPTTALDVTIQEQILKIFRSIADSGTALLYVTHDLAVVSQLCETLSVIYHGEIVEEGTLRKVFDTPEDDYTRQLLSSTPYLKGRMKAAASDNAKNVDNAKKGE
ncbi:ATP-binding cassette domain-containing protein [Bifidobacterium sp. SMB2]|uniref:ATP-binding cassette domain-containing protein n=1 Tax=Bifidobacterium saimiriisciurei TaxID=2661627 RepID=A0ABX0CB59_9BIFI|nr:MULTISPECIES: ABC transporter ATP-binding protein [Bifidobacterium]NEG96777.1 ATP-binding cassette domain-containing protein [Bifidobacterium sp. SMB2]NEH12343.1 ATP-binding cassette domain-containing protein [Bifidobacterium saimiriisciurei]